MHDNSDLHDDLHPPRRQLKDRFDKSMAVKTRDFEQFSSVQKEFFALLGHRLDFAEARLGQLSVNQDGSMAFAHAQDAGEFNKIQEGLADAQMRLHESAAASAR